MLADMGLRNARHWNHAFNSIFFKLCTPRIGGIFYQDTHDGKDEQDSL